MLTYVGRELNSNFQGAIAPNLLVARRIFMHSTARNSGGALEGVADGRKTTIEHHVSWAVHVDQKNEIHY